ncbi:MAG TPA: hypothetical protein VMU24_12830 [Candidatus Acidoferrales bacterium]|nr:hypothetical protein [Candidatus Acidoferrales bacterium]
MRYILPLLEAEPITDKRVSQKWNPRSVKRWPEIIPKDFRYLNQLVLTVPKFDVKLRAAAAVAYESTKRLDRFAASFQEALDPIR